MWKALIALIPSIAIAQGVVQSSEFREFKSYSASFSAGMTVAPVPSVGVNLGYFYDSQSIFQFEYSKGKVPVRVFDIETQTIAINYQRFFGNSFYGKIGITDRQIKGSNLNFFGVLNSDVNAAVESLGGELSLGNQWQWNKMTIGCDWLGIFIPFTVLSTDYDRAGVSDIEKRSIEIAARKLGLLMSVRVAQFYIGASF